MQHICSSIKFPKRILLARPEPGRKKRLHFNALYLHEIFEISADLS